MGKKKFYSKLNNNFQSVIASVNDIFNSSSQPLIKDILEVIAEFSDADRAYVFKNYFDERGIPYCKQMHEYNKATVSAEIDNQILQKFYFEQFGMQWLYNDLINGRTISKKISELHKSEKIILESQEIKSILITPVFINQELWGFVGYDDCKSERSWRPEEELALISVGTMVANFIEKAEIQQALKKEKEFYKTILDNSYEGISILSPTLEVLYQSSTNCKILGYTSEEYQQLNIFKLIHPDDFCEAQKTFSFILDNPESPVQVELRYKHKNGHYIDLEMTAVNLLHRKEVEGIVVNFRDISVRKDVEHKLHQKEAHLQKAQILGKVGSWYYDFISEEMEWSDEIFRTYGVGINEIPSNLESFYSIVHPDDVNYVKKELEFSQESLQNTELYFRILRPDGEIKHLFSRIEYVFNDKNNPIGIFGSQQDITHIIAIESALEMSKEQYQRLFQMSPLPMWIYDVNTYKFMDVNQAAIDEYGYSKEEFLEMTIKDIRPASEVKKLQKVIEDIKLKSESTSGIFKHRKKDGEIFFVDVKGNSINDKYRMVVVKDVTESLKYIRKIEEQNKALYEIAWTQAHVVRSPLANLIGLISLLESNKTELDPYILKSILESAQKLDEIIKEIITKSTEVEKNTHAIKKTDLIIH